MQFVQLIIQIMLKHLRKPNKLCGVIDSLHSLLLNAAITENLLNRVVDFTAIPQTPQLYWSNIDLITKLHMTF